MKRSVAVLVWILIGAAASGLGTGYFLYQANRDRQTLAQEAQTANAQAEQAKTATQQLANDANQKLEAAAAEVAKAQELMKRVEEERQLMAQASPLEKLSVSVLRYWNESIAVALGLSLRIPPGSAAFQTDNSLGVFTQNTSNEFHREQWLSITSYDPSGEQSLNRDLTGTSTLTYLVSGRLLVGVRGKSSNGADPYPVYVLHVESAASSTHLIWAHATPLVSEKKILDTLSTLSFRS